MNFIKKRGKYYLLFVLMLVFIDLYYGVLAQEWNIQYVIYFNMLMILIVLPFFLIDRKHFLEREQEEKRTREELEYELKCSRESNGELQDYIAKWCHEYKIPLAASLLLAEKIEDTQARMSMKEQLQRMNKQLNSMLLGCKMQSSLFDLQIQKTVLKDCIRASIKNNQFFLIQNGFDIRVDVEGQVYTDPTWLTYVLDQIIDNAIKYKMQKSMIRFWTEKEQNGMKLYIEDYGEGIREEDLGRIFEKGFTGKNYHNGKYKSTGLGLYMAAKIICKLNHHISVESEYQKFTRFCIEFRQHDYFLQEL